MYAHEASGRIVRLRSRHVPQMGVVGRGGEERTKAVPTAPHSARPRGNPAAVSARWSRPLRPSTAQPPASPLPPSTVTCHLRFSDDRNVLPSPVGSASRSCRVSLLGGECVFGQGAPAILRESVAALLFLDQASGDEGEQQVLELAAERTPEVGAR